MSEDLTQQNQLTDDAKQRMNEVLASFGQEAFSFDEMPQFVQTVSVATKLHAAKAAPIPKPTGNPVAAEKIRDAAGRMQKDIDRKFESASNMRALPPTRKRTQDSQGIYNDGVRLTKYQTVLYKLADMHEAGTIPAELAKVNSRAAVEREVWNIPALREMYDAADRPETKAEKLARLEREAILSKIPGFFATPEEVADDMVRHLGELIRPGAKVLESSAGSGRLIDAILRAQPEASVHYFEANYKLREFLRFKYEGRENVYCVGDDFMEWDNAHPMRYDFAVLNPPFENGQDIDHILKTYELLKPGAVMTAICSPGALFRKDRKASGFQEWLSTVNHDIKRIESGAFKSSGTMVASTMIRIQKRYE